MGEVTSKKILVIDDSILERELLIEILKESNIANEFLQAKTADEAIEILGHRYKEICLILLDWQMPEMSGLEFMQGVVAVEAVKRIPIIMVTAADLEQDKQRAKEINPNLAGYVAKPYEPEDLVNAVKPYLK